MSIAIDLAKELVHKKPIPFLPVPGSFKYCDKTPAHTFTTFVMPVLAGQYCVALPSRDSIDERLATAILTFIDSRNNLLSIQSNLILLELFNCPGFSFDTIAVLNPASAKQYEHENENMNKRAFVAFPLFRCELSGNESPDLIDLIRHDFLPTLDWNREPCPQISMSFLNTRTKARSKRVRPSLTDMQNVLSEIDNLLDADGSWIKIDNYAGRQCRILSSTHNYVVEFPGQEAKQLDKSTLIKLLSGFLTIPEIISRRTGKENHA